MKVHGPYQKYLYLAELELSPYPTATLLNHLGGEGASDIRFSFVL